MEGKLKKQYTRDVGGAKGAWSGAKREEERAPEVDRKPAGRRDGRGRARRAEKGVC